ncbi:hypothetical protein FZ983_16350 [Azospirillum sp. B21]|uniref:hypothetical protein n=1 Tax=Azospirillum sp. B21 TaxID=2607496 RepID=UPI0011EE1A6D|nr:hypothetical protein [Azospirillum sp. B21]KAA0578910.1 hypothetical protein FZ983_16350 [Azospirillum sp. B21]
MKRSGHILAVLLFAFALLFGAVGGAMAHVDMQAGPSDHHHGETRDGTHKAALTVAAPCCPAAEAPATDRLPAPVRWADASWPQRPDYAPDKRAIAPETPPPKSSL